MFKIRRLNITLFFVSLFCPFFMNGGKDSFDTPIFQEAFLPNDHPLQDILKNLFLHPEMFSSPLALEDAGFVMKWNSVAANSGTIFVASHPSILTYLIKKYCNSENQFSHLERYLARIQGSRKIAQYIKDNNLIYITVPKKWLYCLPANFNNLKTGEADYLLIVEHMDICEGGWWGGETFEKYKRMNLKMVQELCCVLQDLRGCDAWPQNQPFTRSGKIAFIDTEHLGRSYGDFITRTIRYINPIYYHYAHQMWCLREKAALMNEQ